MSNPIEILGWLAESYGVQTTYEDDQHRRCEASPEALLAVLRVLGAPVQRLEDAVDALRHRRQQVWQRPLEPIAVAWDGRAQPLKLRLPLYHIESEVVCRLEFEGAETKAWSARLYDLPEVEAADVEGVPFTVRSLWLPEGLPPGYHRLTVEVADQMCEALVISSATRAYAAPEFQGKLWGGFLPLYALRSANDWGVGDFTDLGNLIDYVQQQGGGIVGTLPLDAAFLDQLFEPSPYSPASRLFWNELYLDVNRLLREAGIDDFRGRPEIERELGELRSLKLVDYQRVAALKRQALERIVQKVFAGSAPAEFENYRSSHPRLADYAAFRAMVEKQRAPWQTWPVGPRDGLLKPGDYDEPNARYHAYVQWLADKQLHELSDRASARGPGLYFDLPLGVNPDSYDVWRDREAFALGISAGAPPDSFFTKGQDWGFPPLHPENNRLSGYKYLRDTLHHHLQYAGMLRIDHLMGLHRFYWVPHGLGAAHGVYVRYPDDELYAVYCLESNRNKAILIGEDLGTVPPAVRPAMSRHNIHRLYIGQFEMLPNYDRPFGPAAPGAMGTLNTHDMPTFAAFWTGLDISDRMAVGYLDERTSRQEAERRQHIREAVKQYLRRVGFLGDNDDLPHILRACLQAIAQTDVGFVLVNFEDLWQMTQPQNVPGTWREQPNWRRRAEVAFEAFNQVPGLQETLATLNKVVRR
jgi:4-alpha-glucanotransferase